MARCIISFIIDASPSIGAPRDGHGLHGTHSLTPARDVRWVRERRDDDLVVRVTGMIDDARMFGRRVRVARTITVSTGSPGLEVRDVVTNGGVTVEPLAWLYHVNIGALVLVPGTSVSSPGSSWVAREQTPVVPAVVPASIARSEEAVFERLGVAAEDGWASATVLSPDDEGVTVSWIADPLPRLYQWVLPERGAWALGIEPSNAPLWGDSAPPVLRPGESVETAVVVTAV